MTRTLASSGRPKGRPLDLLQPSDDLQVLMKPGRMYSVLTAARDTASWPEALSRPLLVAFILGASTSIAATGVVSAISIASGTVCWAFVPAVQCFNGLLLGRRPPQRLVNLPRAMELLFLTHTPWSLWLIAATLVLVLLPLSPRIVWVLLATALVPLVWTRVLTMAFCRAVLGCSRGEALRRTVIHGAVTLTAIFLYVSYAIALLPRIAPWFGW